MGWALTSASAVAVDLIPAVSKKEVPAKQSAPVAAPVAQKPAAPAAQPVKKVVKPAAKPADDDDFGDLFDMFKKK